MFIHDAVLESLTCGDTQILASGLSSAIKRLLKIKKEVERKGQRKWEDILMSESSGPISVPAAVNISVHVNASVSEHVSCIGQKST